MASKFHITGVGTIGVRAFSKFAISTGLLQTHMVYFSIYMLRVTTIYRFLPEVQGPPGA